MRRTIFQTLIIIAISAAIATASAFLHPRAPAWYLTETPDPWVITPDRIDDLGADILWVDARPAADFEKGHHPGALSLNEDNWGDQVFENQDVLSEAIGNPVIVYCDGSGCERSKHIAERLRQLVGLERVYHLKGDWRELESTGLSR
ncbi:MAG: rhodanese-like domain-containing protein [Verrucomicrobiae bacterium]|nr:rhodanese-like domain-containing protein [Verrucomicrobiae bacterium]